MSLIIHHTSQLSGQIRVPSSKSHQIRSLFVGLMACGRSVLHHTLDCEDVRNAMGVAQALGVACEMHGLDLHVQSDGCGGWLSPEKIYTGNSGLTSHFVLPLLGLRKQHTQHIEVDCGEQMRARPIASFVASLRTLGLLIDYVKTPGCFPLRIAGQIQGGCVTVPGEHSQYVSALLLTLPCAIQASEIRVHHLRERSYVEMTLQYLREQSIRYEHVRETDLDIFYIQGEQRYQAFQKNMPADFSSASNVITAAALTEGCVEIFGLDINDSQPDKHLIGLLQNMGARIQVLSDRLVMDGRSVLRGTSIDADQYPDLLPILAVAGCFASHEMQLLNVAHARLKETDRIHAMCEGLQRLGARVLELPDGLSVKPSVLHGANVSGYGDHRTIMALSVAGLLASGATVIDDARAVDKTFPDFVLQMQLLGARMELMNAV